tara:strand:- start:68 stop:808 length:741 start_codon:yes stop_codon:yes gene_type:complete
MTYSNWREELFEGKAEVFKTAFGVARKVFKGRPASINYRVTRGKNFKLTDRYKDVASTIQYPQRAPSPYANFSSYTTKNMTAIPNKARDSYYTTGRPSFMRQKYNVLDPNQFRAISNLKGKIYKPSDKLLKKDLSKIGIARKKGLLQGDDEFKSLVDMRKSEFNKQKELYDKQVKKSNKDTYRDPKTGKIRNIPPEYTLEQAMASPTNNVGDGKIAGTVEAGDNPPVKKKKRYIYGGRGSRKNWMV